MSTQSASVTVVQACMRSELGGSPTAIVSGEVSAAEGHRIAKDLAVSHVVCVRSLPDQSSPRPVVALRFFTSKTELPACGHGTVAALAFLATQAHAVDYQVSVHAGGRSFAGRAARRGELFDAYFELDDVDLRPASAVELERVSGALRAAPELIAGEACVASPGRPRLLLPLIASSAVLALEPDLSSLAAVCEELGLLGCYVHSPPDASGHLTARMFAPSIGVAEDAANANSSGCLAARLAEDGIGSITVDMGDSVGQPATIKANMRTTPTGRRIEVGGSALVVQGD